MDTKVQARLNASLPEVYRRVLARAVLVVRRTGWKRQTHTVADAAEELAQEAIVRTLEGKRQWDPSRVPDLESYLYWVMRSIVHAAAQSPGSRVAFFDDEQETSLESLSESTQDAATPEATCLLAEEVALREKAIWDAAGDDPILLKLVEAVMDGCGKPAEIADKTGWPPKVVYEAMRKLRRRVEVKRRKEVDS